MTTLVGIVAKKNGPSVVMASDLSGTMRSWENRGEMFVKKETTKETQKIHIDKKGELAVSVCGIADENCYDFIYSLKEGDIDFRKSIEEGFFDELVNLNLNRFIIRKLMSCLY